MASIRKKETKSGTKYYVIYYYEDKEGKKHQKWEQCKDFKHAQERKAELGYRKHEFEYVKLSCTMVGEFLDQFVETYDKDVWALSTYEGNTGLIEHYIKPTIGKVKLQDITPLFIRNYYQKLTGYKAVKRGQIRPKNEFISAVTIRNIHKILRCAFGYAAEMEVIRDNPFAKVKPPKASYKKREAWTPDIIQKALNSCKDNKLFIAMNLAFVCSMRIGEIIALTWDNVHISEEEIESGNAHMIIDKELQRASMKSINTLNHKDIYYIFEPVMRDAKTRLVLKAPKTESSIRKVWIPETLANILMQWRKKQYEFKEFLGDEYNKYVKDGKEYQFVVSQPNGVPCEDKLISKSLNKLIKDNDLPNTVFHSLRKSSATYKLKESGGDIKAVQGDGGWAEPDMVTKTYSEILDEDRKINAQRFDKSFYKTPIGSYNLPYASETTDVNSDVVKLFEILQRNPGLLQMLSSMNTLQNTR